MLSGSSDSLLQSNFSMFSFFISPTEGVGYPAVLLKDYNGLRPLIFIIVYYKTISSDVRHSYCFIETGRHGYISCTELCIQTVELLVSHFAVSYYDS